MDADHPSSARPLPEVFRSVQICIVIGYLFFFAAFSLSAPPLVRIFQYLDTCYDLTQWFSALLKAFCYWYWALAAASLFSAAIGAIFPSRQVSLLSLLVSMIFLPNAIILLWIQVSLYDPPEVFHNEWISYDEFWSLLTMAAIIAFVSMSCLWWCYVLLRSFARGR